MRKSIVFKVHQNIMNNNLELFEKLIILKINRYIPKKNRLKANIDFYPNDGVDFVLNLCTVRITWNES